MKMDQTEKLILEAIDQHRDEIIEFARDIYDHGELGYKEFNTAEKFIKKMKELGLRTETGLAITGTKAYLNEEKKDTASLALLGELDALRIPEHAHANPETDAAHCCGHHAQMAGIFGAALAVLILFGCHNPSLFSFIYCLNSSEWYASTIACAQSASLFSSFTTT